MVGGRAKISFGMPEEDGFDENRFPMRVVVVVVVVVGKKMFLVESLTEGNLANRAKMSTLGV